MFKERESSNQRRLEIPGSSIGLGRSLARRRFYPLTAMQSLLDFLKGKKTYLIAVLAAIYGAGIQEGAWEHYPLIDALLAASGAAALRAGIGKQVQLLIAGIGCLALLTGCTHYVHERPTTAGIERTSFGTLLYMGIKDAGYSRTVSIGSLEGEGDKEMIRVIMETAIEAGAKAMVK